MPRGGAPGCPGRGGVPRGGGEPRAASGRTCFPGRPAELRSLQATAPEGFGSSRVSSPSSFTSCRIKLTKAASSRLGRRSFSSKPSRQSGQPARCLPLQYSTMQGRQKLWLQPVSRTGSLKYCRQQAQLRSTAPRSRSRSTAAAMARPGPGRSGAERPAEFRFPRAPPPERLLPCPGKPGERRGGRRRGAGRLSSDITCSVRPLRCTGMGPATRLCPTAEPATRCSPGAAQPGSSPRQAERPVPTQLFLCWRLGSEDLGWLQKLTVTRSSP